MKTIYISWKDAGRHGLNLPSHIEERLKECGIDAEVNSDIMVRHIAIMFKNDDLRVAQVMGLISERITILDSYGTKHHTFRWLDS